MPYRAQLGLISTIVSAFADPERKLKPTLPLSCPPSPNQEQHQTDTLLALRIWRGSALSSSKTLPNARASCVGSGFSLLPLIQSCSLHYALTLFYSAPGLPLHSQRLINVSIKQRSIYALQNHWPRFCNFLFFSLTL